MEIDGFTGSEIGFLRRGGWAATRSALAMLHRRGAIQLGSTGTITRLPSALAGCDIVERALYATLTGPSGPHELLSAPRVQSTLTLVRRRLTAAGLLRPRWWRTTVPPLLLIAPAIPLGILAADHTLPFWLVTSIGAALLVAAAVLSLPRTFYGSRSIRRLKTRYADLAHPADAHTLTANEVGMAVALFGNPALKLIIPTARSAGLTR